MAYLTLVRHGQSLWNAQNRFTGWVDVPLTAEGENEARAAGRSLASFTASRDFTYDVAYTSVLTRAIETQRLISEATPLSVPVVRDSALNERHYGDLQGLNKAETAAKFGEEQVHIWRRSYDIAPPNGESLKDTLARVEPFFANVIMTDLEHGRHVLVVAHGNSNRAIVKLLEDIADDEIPGLELATGDPRHYSVADGTATRIEE